MTNELKVTYTPSEDQLREAWVEWSTTGPVEPRYDRAEYAAEFDRFLQARDAEKFEEGRNASVQPVIAASGTRLTLAAVLPQPENPYKDEL